MGQPGFAARYFHLAIFSASRARRMAAETRRARDPRHAGHPSRSISARLRLSESTAARSKATRPLINAAPPVLKVLDDSTKAAGTRDGEDAYRVGAKAPIIWMSVPVGVTVFGARSTASRRAIESPTDGADGIGARRRRIRSDAEACDARPFVVTVIDQTAGLPRRRDSQSSRVRRTRCRRRFCFSIRRRW